MSTMNINELGVNISRFVSCQSPLTGKMFCCLGKCIPFSKCMVFAYYNPYGFIYTPYPYNIYNWGSSTYLTGFCLVFYAQICSPPPRSMRSMLAAVFRLWGAATSPDASIPIRPWVSRYNSSQRRNSTPSWKSCWVAPHFWWNPDETETGV